MCTDPYVEDDRLVPLERVLSESELLVVGAPHRAYRETTWPYDTPVVDVWGVTERGIDV